MKHLHIYFRPDNPTRDVDWRWQLSGYVASNLRGKVPSAFRSDLLHKAVVLRRLLENDYPSENQRMNALERMPACYEAWNYYSDSNSHYKWEMEARLLARESYVEIGRKVGTTEYVVDAYEQLFFNIKDKLDSPGYITHKVFGRAVHNGMTARDYDCLWKMMAYWLGPYVLDAIVYTFNNPAPVGNNAAVLASVDSKIHVTTKLRALTAIHAVPVNWETATQIIELYQKSLMIERSANESGMNSATSTITANIEAFVNNIPWRKRTTETPPIADKQLNKLRIQGISLRSKELTLQAEGQMTEEALDVISSANFPE